MIHQYKLNGYNIVLDVYSGAVHVVDEVAYDVISLYETTPRDEIVARMLDKYGHLPDVDEQELRDCLADIDELKDAGKLFSRDLWADVEQEAFEHTKPVLKAMCLHVAHTCNLNCKYCFASQGKYHGDRALMSFEVGRQALDFLIASSGSRVNLRSPTSATRRCTTWSSAWTAGRRSTTGSAGTLPATAATTASCPGSSGS